MERNREDDVLGARLRDAVRLAQNGGRPHFIGFLDERQADFVQHTMKQLFCENYMLWGGYDDAERVVFGVFPDFLVPDASAFPIEALTVSFRRADTLTHRDFLGSFLSKGIERETLGDILVEEGRCVLFVRSEIADFVRNQTDKVGRVGVKLSPGAEEPLPAAHRFEEFQSVVASARLDCIVAAAIGSSREKAGEIIRAGLVMVNHEVSTSLSAAVSPGSKLSIRGKGRFIVDRIGPLTKKGRLSIAGRKYI
ncbi:MAG: hypothetical protein E7518_08290 [Ruminococcaceae bacterium]|nr:hypothetical protein [Oscillospiraceae bacterium]